MPLATGSLVGFTLVVEELNTEGLGAGGILGGGLGVLFFVGVLLGSGIFVGFAGRAGIDSTGFMGFGVLLGFVAAVIGSVVFTGIGRPTVGLFVRTGSLYVVWVVPDVK